MVAFNSVKSVLSIIASKGVDVLFVHNSGREGAFADIHWGKVLPFIGLDIVHFAGVQEHVLDTIIASHYVDYVIVDDSCMLFPHLAHTSLLEQLFLLI